MKKTAIFCAALVLLAFLAILMVTGALGQAFGKRVEMIALILVALGLVAALLLNRRDG